MNKSILVGAVTTLALTACANIGPRGFDSDGVAALTVLDEICATAQVRCIDVLIQGGVITQVKDEDFVGANHLILWKVKAVSSPSPPYTFLEDGIKLKAASPVPPANEFNCRPVAQNKLFICSNRNTVARTYTYNVKMADGAGRPLPVFDPKIVNQ